jgi:hypothetical protein
MNSAIVIRFLTPYVSSITRDQDYVHSPMPLDGALAHAAYWQALVAGHVTDSPTGGQADPVLMRKYVTPVLDATLASVSLGDAALLDDGSISEWVYAISSGFPIVENQLYIKYGARWIDFDGGTMLAPAYEVQPIRKRVPVDRVSALDLTWVGERGKPLTREPETGKGVLKAIDNRITTWQVYEYVWFAEILDESRLKQLLDVLKYQGMGKKRSAGFGKVLDYGVYPLSTTFPGLTIKRRLFLDRQSELVLLRPLPYDAIMLAQSRVVMTNLVVESGCGFRPPYWSDRCVVAREGTIFRFLS